MKNIFCILSTIALLLTVKVSSQTVTIGLGSNPGAAFSNVGVIYRSSAGSGFDFSQQYFLYTASELAAAGIIPGTTITSIAWNKTNTGATVGLNNSSTWNVYMKNSLTTPNPNWSDSDFDNQIIGATLVYSSANQVIPNTIGWVNLTLQTPFVYNGGSIEIGSSWNCSAFAGNPTTGSFTWAQDPIDDQCFGGSSNLNDIFMTGQTARPQVQFNITLPPACSGIPSGGVITGNNSICSGSNFTLGLSGTPQLSGLTYQWFNSVDNVTFSAIPGATQSSYTSTFSAPLYYRCAVSCSNSGLSSTTTSFYVSLAPAYECACSSGAISTLDDDIAQITFGTFSNPTIAPSQLTFNPLANETYTDYTNLTPIDVQLGTTYPFTLTQFNSNTYYQCQYGIYIDYNHNGVFEANESFDTIGPINELLTGPHLSMNLTIPLNATPGLTLMRIVIDEIGPVAPCGTYNWGETEDYLINIACPVLAKPVVPDQPVCNNSSVTFSATPQVLGAVINWYSTLNGTVPLLTGNAYSTPLLNGNYTVYAEQAFPGCPSSLRDSAMAILSPVNLTLQGVDASCNGFNNGTFFIADFLCGSPSFEFSVNNGSFTTNPPNNLYAGTYSVVIKDGLGQTSPPITIVISEPSAPTNLGVSDISFFDATLSWTPQGTETSWVVEWGPVGFQLGTGNDTVISTPNFLIDDQLQPDNFYDFYVAAGCSPTSDYAGPFTFSTDGKFFTWDDKCVNFVDISSVGINANLTDESEINVPLPFNFNYQGNNFSAITIGNNGALQFGNTAVPIVWNNEPVANAGSNQLLPFWDDLASEGNGVFYHSTGAFPDRKFIIQWNKSHYNDIGETFEFEVILEEGTNEIFFIYNDKTINNTLYDYGASATIGASGATNLQISFDNPGYLTNKSCIHFYRALCPKIQTLNSIIYPDDALLNWNPGAYNETTWTIKYDLEGFDPTTGGNTITVNSPFTDFGSTLQQLTTYDVYIYSECTLDNLTSDPYFYQFTTKPNCGNPSNLNTISGMDSITASWNWSPNLPSILAQSYNIQYVQTPNQLYEGTVYSHNSTTQLATVNDPQLIGGGVYNVYVQAVCDNGDTSQYIGPVEVIMPISNDGICNAESLSFEYEYTFSNVGATITAQDTFYLPPVTGAQTTNGWENDSINNTVWFQFNAPNSGAMRIEFTSPLSNMQAAVFSATNCLDTNPTFIGGNDNDPAGGSLSPNFTVCGLTPGALYYLLVDGNHAPNQYSLILKGIYNEVGTSNGVTEICEGESLNLFSTLSGQTNDGTWSSPIGAVNGSISNGILNSTFLSTGSYTLNYSQNEGCFSDTVSSIVKIKAPQTAGIGSTLTVCLNSPVSLSQGLTTPHNGSGIWLEANNDTLSSPSIHAPGTGGTYTYTYIVTDTVCQNDTAYVAVYVDSTCNYLSIEEYVNDFLSIYPNPNAGIFVLSSTNDDEYELLSSSGQLIFIDKVFKGENAIDLSHLKIEDGIYYLRLKSKGEIKKIAIYKN